VIVHCFHRNSAIPICWLEYSTIPLCVQVGMEKCRYSPIRLGLSSLTICSPTHLARLVTMGSAFRVLSSKLTSSLVSGMYSFLIRSRHAVIPATDRL